ncbi:MAG: hypothetical protein M3R30_04635, partial [Candidatus Eremiobacteraeota bacterium]|nr:hypothetical protein [Candidatus Eremiobacteraeota bacterium]
ELTRAWAEEGALDPEAVRARGTSPSLSRRRAVRTGAGLRRNPGAAEFLGRSGLPVEVFGCAELPSDLQLQLAQVLKKGPPLPV